jgi:hypothetical protein
MIGSDAQVRLNAWCSTSGHLSWYGATVGEELWVGVVLVWIRQPQPCFSETVLLSHRALNLESGVHHEWV